LPQYVTTFTSRQLILSTTTNEDAAKFRYPRGDARQSAKQTAAALYRKSQISVSQTEVPATPFVAPAAPGVPATMHMPLSQPPSITPMGRTSTKPRAVEIAKTTAPRAPPARNNNVVSLDRHRAGPTQLVHIRNVSDQRVDELFSRTILARGKTGVDRQEARIKLRNDLLRASSREELGRKYPQLKAEIAQISFAKKDTGSSLHARATTVAAFSSGKTAPATSARSSVRDFLARRTSLKPAIIKSQNLVKDAALLTDRPGRNVYAMVDRAEVSRRLNKAGLDSNTSHRIADIRFNNPVALKDPVVLAREVKRVAPAVTSSQMTQVERVFRDTVERPFVKVTVNNGNIDRSRFLTSPKDISGGDVVLANSSFRPSDSAGVRGVGSTLAF